MIRAGGKGKPSGTLLCIVGVLALSGTLRIGGMSIAVASESPDQAAMDQNMATQQCEVDPDIGAMLEVISTRTAALDEREQALLDRSHAIKAANVLVENNLKRLAEAERKLAETIAQVDGAAESDLDRLTSVYESMKPKVAAALFEQMAPDFAAGFLGRMAPQSAADIMSSLSSDTGYAISVVLAGRNANAPTE
ncbi:hypothetical protein [uncultured Litoreibacter sp.]|uniref:MotE family protein n=1 Tax=uncultured Litoreibacter sp. TaxID=1392394 RepID=UPI002605DED6|nr:hypothetical protein [uncultured Litoreibacter sp.]